MRIRVIFGNGKNKIQFYIAFWESEAKIKRKKSIRKFGAFDFEICWLVHTLLVTCVIIANNNIITNFENV